ncbi:CHAD domain-containing protein [uncultured Methanoregula sp.]|uniref:CHAD domain-containing protein n=1 Tax=uncultured Methanoregula sp. TaxID=1005933 RepID=UPI002AABC330|nr:CHAD domain-containing protein [uncultured Methanoregula sp.]
MIALPDGALPNTAMRWFGMQQLPPRLEAFEKEMNGVREAKDIEYIHRMRVASRRLRAALPLFRECFPKKQYQRWMQEIANITRALGEARDADVQIAYLQKQIKKSNSIWKEKHPDAGNTESPEGPALQYLLAELRKKRSGLQSRVVSALDALQKSRIVPEMRTFFAAARSSQSQCPSKALMYGISPVSAIRIDSRLRTLLSYETWVNHPEAVAEHHATRIAAKKLRYTMELFGPVYRLGLNKPLSRVKKIQEILGDIHDCDVWIDTIVRILLHERSRLRSENEEKRPDTKTLASLKILLRIREKERSLLFYRFTRFWESQKKAGLWDELKTTLLVARKKPFHPKTPLRQPDVRAAVTLLASVYPEGIPHSSNVTRLALMLFDSLQPLHQMDPEERFLLECAGMLHDIGWTAGQRRHNRQGAKMIFAAETLPLDIPERAIICLAIISHRGRSNPELEEYYRILSEKQQRTALSLAAILRVADGFDYSRTGSVQEVHAVIGTDQVVVDAISAADIAVEKEHARIKSDLFSRAFSRELVIR